MVGGRISLRTQGSKGPFALDDNDVFFLSSCANSYIGNYAIHLWRHEKYADNNKNLCRCRQVQTDPNCRREISGTIGKSFHGGGAEVCGCRWGWQWVLNTLSRLCVTTHWFFQLFQPGHFYSYLVLPLLNNACRPTGNFQHFFHNILVFIKHQKWGEM